MLKVMIADDERVIRETISRLIDWQSLGLELIGVCKNGIEAYDMILDESPDIVLTDIKMPGLSGIELIGKVAATNHDTQFILLSGFGEFDYAREAMKYGVRHYLLKPCSEEQIIEALREAIRECCDRRMMNQTAQSSARETLYQNIIVEILNELAMITDSCYARVYEPYKKYLDFDNVPYDLFYIYGLPRDGLTECYKALLDYHREHAPGFPLHGVYVPGTLMVFCQDFETDRVSGAALMQSLRRLGGQKPLEHEFHALPNLAAALGAVWDKARCHGTVRYMSELRSIPTCNYRGVIHTVKKLCQDIRALRAGAAERAAREAKLNELLAVLDGVINPDFLLQLCSSILLSFSNDSLFCTPVEATERIIELQGCEGTEDIRAHFDGALRAMALSGESAEHNELISRIERYVAENLDNPELTLKWIAETYLFMNVDYVSRKFVRETGGKFSKYLTDARIQRAKMLLAEGGDEKIQSIAERVGCGNNPQYFSQIFKKNTGMTPSAYAKQMGCRQRAVGA